MAMLAKGPMAGPGDLTRLLDAARTGDEDASARVIATAYQELRALARARLRRERADHTLQPTELVHEAYLRLLQAPTGWESRAHFFGAAAQAMRRILVDHARRRAAEKRGGAARRVTLGELTVGAPEPDVDVLALDEALTALAAEDARLGRLVHLRYFAGFSIADTAEALGVSPATVKRDWAYARAWLVEYMGE